MEAKPKLKGRQHFDEKYIKVNGKDHDDLNCIDHKGSGGVFRINS